MFHHVAHALDERPLFTDWASAAALWDDLFREFHGVEAAVLLPDHVHVVAREPQRRALSLAAAAYSRWRCWQRGDAGALWEPVPPAEAFAGKPHLRRGVRYVHLNACRAGLVDCPVGWPFSTYRDRLGLAARGVVPTARDPVAFHQRTSADGSTAVGGTPFPGGELEDPRPDLRRVACAVSEWRRVPLERLTTNRYERVWLLAAARSLTSWSGSAIADAFDVSRAAVHRAGVLTPLETRVVERLLVDRRFPGLVEGDARLRRWRPRRRAS
ncbi:MAG: hypothetical protein H6742_00490 [Alphaproteobacteria bacterium]|nr:hypothetical protein [Alphaproteobacteria bacterium]